MNPLFSIIISVYNVAPYLDRCLQSACGQTYEHIEIIAVDDGSTDESPAICDAWAQKDSRIHVIHKENGGASDARNTGLLAATGEYILFVDSDDYIELTACEDLLPYIAQKPDMIVFDYYTGWPGDTQFLNQQICFADGEVLDGNTYNCRGKQNYCSQCMVWMYLYRRAFLLENNLFFRKGWINEDMEFEPRALAAAGKMIAVHRPIYHCVHREGSLSRTSVTWKNAHDVFLYLPKLVPYLGKVGRPQSKKVHDSLCDSRLLG